ncbi:glycosyltransferase [Variovorax sp. dw_954]|uniref:glycosyltransferase family 2 protein n=1 Tax=Variovorax sp. dw_954 TaxID=2720078 RepID=UPI001BD5C19E|nr:glycosyltransferase [Variovorax sp. dw_954]
MFDYDNYVVEYDRHAALEQREVHCHIQTMCFRPNFIVVIENGSVDDIATTRATCVNQVYPVTFIAHSLEKAAAAECGNAYLIWLQAGDRLHFRALYEFASRLNADHSCQLLYCDEDTWGSSGRCDPFFKPEWSPDYLEATNYIGSSACYALSLAKELLATVDCQYDLVLRVCERATCIAHIPQILLHRRAALDAPLDESMQAKNVAALTGRLSRTGRTGHAEAVIAGRSCYRMAVDLKSLPLVSIVIPTAAKIVLINGRPRDLIAACLSSIAAMSTYANIEVVVVDNGDLDRNRLAHIKAFPIRYVTYRDSQVNISRKLNMGAACAAGEILLLLNDDTEVLTCDWIERLLVHFEKPHVGAVGARLLYPDMTIQHAGVVSILGHPDHVTRWISRRDSGYFFSNAGARNYLSVTGALTMTTARYYREVGGYDENLPLCFNDIDLCYKLVEKGLTVVYEPGAELIHFESVSANNPYRIEDRDIFMNRWGHRVVDPYYNARWLSQIRATFAFSNNCRSI